MKLISELKRRNVFRMALLYLGAAWLIMQVVDLLIDRGPLPDSIGPITLTVLAVGFPIALIISWFYEVTPEGISRDTDEQPAESATGFAGRRVDFVIIAVLAAAVLVFAYDKWWTEPPPERSVAVLPFVNMSADGAADYLGAGVADTILNMLVTIPDLHVASRTSSFQPRLQGLSIPEVAALLGVTTVLEGSIQRQGDRLRITAQLVDAEDDNHLWSRNFDRDYGDVFAIQDEIAQATASALELSLLGEAKQRIDREDTDNLEAFEEYSRAIENLRVRTVDSVRQAAEQLQRAVEADPDFARAHAMLGYVYLQPRYHSESALGREELRVRVRDIANTALQIAPGMSTALVLLGHLTEEDDARGQLYREAVQNGPNDTLAIRAYATHLFMNNKQIAEATELVEKLIRLDPLDEKHHWQLGMQQLIQGQISAALETVAHGKEKVPDSVELRDLEAFCHLGIGDYSSAIVAKYETLDIDPNEFVNRWSIATIYLLAGMPDEAERWFERAAATAPDQVGNQIRHVGQTMMDVYYQRDDEEVFAALGHWLENSSDWPYGIVKNSPAVPFIEYGERLGKLDEVLEIFEASHPHLFTDPPGNLTGDKRMTLLVGLALLRHGDDERGELFVRVGLEELAKRSQASWYVDPASFMLHLALGETDVAVDKLRTFAAQNKFYMAGSAMQFMLRYSSLYDPIRDEPEFVELLETYDKNAAEQRKLLTDMAHELPVK